MCFAMKCDMGKFTGVQIVLLFRDGGRRPVSGLAHRVDEHDLSTLTASDWCNVLAVRPDLASAFEASTHDWAADEKLVSGEDTEMIPAEEFFKDTE